MIDSARRAQDKKKSRAKREKRQNKERKSLYCLFRAAAGFMKKPQDFLFSCRAAAYLIKR